MSSHHTVVIVGGGTAGITTAARLHRADHKLDIAIIEPSEHHYYQPLWTLVGGGVMDKETTRRAEADYIPAGVTWIKSAVSSFNPSENTVTTRDDETITYDWLVVAVGIQIDWHKIDGLVEALDTPGVCSNYSYEHVDKTWKALREFRGGNAIFTYPSTPIKCGGAPQKIMWLAQHYFEKHGLLDNTKVIFASAGTRIFGVDKYRAVLETLVEKRHIDTRWNHDLVAIRPDEKQAVFRLMDTGEEAIIPYDLLHVVPPMSAPDVIAESELANETGWVDVDKDTLQHVRFPNVFSLGDASSLPTAKTGAAVRKQAPVLVENMRAAMAGKPLTATYNGYTSCPLVTGYGRLILAEFDYDGNPDETFPFDQGKERRSMYWMKKNLLPAMYWRGMLRGRA